MASRRRTVAPCLGGHLYGINAATVKKGKLILQLVCSACVDEIAIQVPIEATFIRSKDMKWTEKEKR